MNMSVLRLVAQVSGAVGLFLLGRTIDDKLGRNVCFVLAAGNVLVILLYLFS